MLVKGRCVLPANLLCLLCLMRTENSSGNGKLSCINICLCLFHFHWYVFFSWVAGCGGSVYARDNGIPVVLFPKTKDEPDGLAPNDLVAELRLGCSSPPPKKKKQGTFICNSLFLLLLFFILEFLNVESFFSRSTSKNDFQFCLARSFWCIHPTWFNCCHSTSGIIWKSQNISITGKTIQ